MTLKQRRIELAQNAGHKPRVFLLLLNEQVNRGLIREITRFRGLLSKVRALTAFTDLEPLNSADAISNWFGWSYGANRTGWRRCPKSPAARQWTSAPPPDPTRETGAKTGCPSPAANAANRTLV